MAEAIKFMSPLGEVASVKPLEDDVQQSIHLPGAVVVTFQKYDPKRKISKVCSTYPPGKIGNK